MPEIPAHLRDAARSRGRRWGRRLVWTALAVLVALAAWGARDLDHKVRAARHDGDTWQDLEKGTERFTDADAEEPLPDTAVQKDILQDDTVAPKEADRERTGKAQTTEDRAVVALRLRDLLVPVRGVEPDELYDSFGDPRSGGRRHRAIDISAPSGTPVLAADDGTITSKASGRLGGNYLFQADDTGSFVYYYAHLDGYAWGVDEGDQVRRGDVLGYVGTTGNAPVGAPHLHFAIYKSVAGQRGPGIPVNPYAVLRGEALRGE